MLETLFVIGGARSGKSRYAQSRAEALALKLVYVATAQAFDEEMHARISLHQADRGPRWQTVEETVRLNEVVKSRAASDTVLLIDCLTLWTTNLILGGHDVGAEASNLISALSGVPGPVILVANEVGLGIVPDNVLARRFRDEAGIINQRIAAEVAEVQLVTAGLPLRLK